MYFYNKLKKFSIDRFTKELEIYSIIGDDREEITLKEQISTEAAGGCVEIWLAQVKYKITFVTWVSIFPKKKKLLNV